jgi:hypothetical protein
VWGEGKKFVGCLTDNTLEKDDYIVIMFPGAYIEKYYL